MQKNLVPLLLAVIAVLLGVVLFQGFQDQQPSLDGFLPENNVTEAETAPVAEEKPVATPAPVQPKEEPKPEPVKPTAKLSAYSDLPEAVRDTFSEEEWAYIAPAIDKTIAAGERKEQVKWATPSGVSGTAFQSGTGTDEDGCRQLRINRESTVVYIEKCANGQFK